MPHLRLISVFMCLPRAHLLSLCPCAFWGWQWFLVGREKTLQVPEDALLLLSPSGRSLLFLGQPWALAASMALVRAPWGCFQPCRARVWGSCDGQLQWPSPPLLILMAEQQYYSSARLAGRRRLRWPWSGRRCLAVATRPRSLSAVPQPDKGEALLGRLLAKGQRSSFPPGLVDLSLLLAPHGPVPVWRRSQIDGTSSRVGGSRLPVCSPARMRSGREAWRALAWAQRQGWERHRLSLTRSVSRTPGSSWKERRAGLLGPLGEGGICLEKGTGLLGSWYKVGGGVEIPGSSSNKAVIFRHPPPCPSRVFVPATVAGQAKSQLVQQLLLGTEMPQGRKGHCFAVASVQLLKALEPCQEKMAATPFRARTPCDQEGGCNTFGE